MARRLGLPVLNEKAPAAPGCGVVGYVSAEEMRILTEIRALGEEARGIKAALAAAASSGADDTCSKLVAHLEELRQRRQHLEVLREAAWRRKMIALGHLEDNPANGVGGCSPAPSPLT